MNPASPTVVKKRKVRRIPRKWLIVGGAAAGTAFLVWQAKRRHARWSTGNGRQPNAFQWWLMGLMDRFAAFIREATADRRNQDPIRVDATTGNPSRPHPGQTEPAPDPRYADANIVDVDAVPATDRPPTRTVPTPTVRDDERDGDAWTKGGAATIPARHRQEYAAMSSHPYVQQLVEASQITFGTYRPRRADGIDVVLDLEQYTLALAEAYESMSTDVLGLAEWIGSEYPTHPGLADYYRQLAQTFVYAGDAARESAQSHRNINAPDFERRDNPRPNEREADLVDGHSY